jgi:hypothetical protein
MGRANPCSSPTERVLRVSSWVNKCIVCNSKSVEHGVGIPIYLRNH